MAERFLGRFPSTELAVRVIDSRYPLVEDTEYRTPEDVQRVLNQLAKNPSLLFGVVTQLPSITRNVIGPWERSAGFGGSLIRQTPFPVEVRAVVAPAPHLYDHEEPHEGATRFPMRGAVRWMVWDGRCWRKGAADDTHEAMDLADAILGNLNVRAVPGRPTADHWKAVRPTSYGVLAELVGFGGDRVRYVWDDPSRRLLRGHKLCSVTKRGRRAWQLTLVPEAMRDGQRRDPRICETRCEAKNTADSLLRAEGWTLR